jgi:1-aminocyclopropane-1-carboxylate deaminase
MTTSEIISADAVTTDTFENSLTNQKKVQLDVLRLDKIHPVVSGNKWFKLQYYTREALNKGYTTLLTFGGPFSNHIAATAHAAKMLGINAIGVIRGEDPKQWSHTLQEAHACHMQLVFLPRNEYDAIKRNVHTARFEAQFGRVYIIPEGGFGALGVRGAADMLHSTDPHYTHVVSAVGTGTTMAGIIQATYPHQQVTGISVMKNNTGLNEEIQSLLYVPQPGRFRIIHDYHFGGYAKHTPSLTGWMNQFYHASTIPLDFVYTAKMMYGIFDLIGKDFFRPQSRILAIHSGGLQGNRSLAPGVLVF